MKVFIDTNVLISAALFLEAFDKMTKEEQEQNIQELIAKYKVMGTRDAGQ